MVDDPTSQTGGQFSDEETIWAAAGVVRRWIETRGIPHAPYTDWENVYVRPPNKVERGPASRQAQFGRMCAALGIQIVAASSPTSEGPRRAQSWDPSGPAREDTASTSDQRRCDSFSTRPIGRPTMRASRTRPNRPRIFTAGPGAARLDAIFRLKESDPTFQLTRRGRYPPARRTVTVCRWLDGRGFAWIVVTEGKAAAGRHRSTAASPIRGPRSRAGGVAPAPLATRPPGPSVHRPWVATIPRGRAARAWLVRTAAALTTQPIQGDISNELDKTDPGH
jgi:hypothetical protein